MQICPDLGQVTQSLLASVSSSVERMLVVTSHGNVRIAGDGTQVLHQVVHFSPSLVILLLMSGDHSGILMVELPDTDFP